MPETKEPKKKGFVRTYTGIPFYYRWIFYAILLLIVIYYKPTGAGLSDISKLDQKPSDKRVNDKPRQVTLRQNNFHLKLLLVFDDASRIFAESLDLPFEIKFIKGQPLKQLEQLEAFIAADKKEIKSKKVLSKMAALATGEYPEGVIKVLNQEKIVLFKIAIDDLNTYARSLLNTSFMLGGVMGQSLATGYVAANRMKYTGILLPQIERKMESVTDIREILIVGEIEKKGAKTIFSLETPSAELKLVLDRLKLKAVPGKNGKISLKEVTDKQLKYFVLLRSFNFIKPILPESLSESIRCTLSTEKVKAPGIFLGEIMQSLAEPFRSEQCTREFFQAMLLKSKEK